MNAKGTLAALACASMVLSVAEAATAIRVDSVTQRWPWNNKVDIAYTIEGGQDVVSSNFCKIVFTTTIGSKTYTIDGTSLGASASEGSHKVTWTLPSGQRGANCTMTAAVYPADVPSGNDYMIVDLATGGISYEGLFATQEESNSRYNTALYKTSKLALRKVPAGGPYPTGDSVNFPNSGATANDSNTEKTWTTDRDYYIGIFPVTQAQYSNVHGANPSSKKTVIAGNTVEHRPAEQLSWFRLRCTDDSSVASYYFASTSPIPKVAVCSGTFFQRLNYMTGLYFDMPTELMYEIALRAGTQTYYHWGNTTNNINNTGRTILDYVVSRENDSDSTVAVGSRLPNAWGFYDMTGNTLEWCLDETVNGNLYYRTDVFTPACSSNSAENRRVRCSGNWDSYALKEPTRYLSSKRGSVKYSQGSSATGFRVSLIVQ